MKMKNKKESDILRKRAKYKCEKNKNAAPNSKNGLPFSKIFKKNKKQNKK